jgi:hypothetical protein
VTISLTGSGVATYLSDVSSASLVFEALALGSSQTKQVLLLNKGTGALTLSAPQVSGAGFTVATSCGSELAIGASCSADVTFSPAVPGAATGILVFSSNATNSPATISLAGSGFDAYAANVALLANFNGTAGATSFVDSSSPSPKSLTTYGAAALSSNAALTGSTSLYLNRLNTTNTDYVVASSPAIPTSGAFTVEGWVYPTYLGANAQAIYNQYENKSTTRTNITLSANTNRLNWGHGQGVSLESTSAVQLNQWTHVAVTRDNANTLRLFVNGVLEASAANYSFGIEQSKPWIGKFNNTSYSGAPFHGYIDGIRVTAGVARYTATFTPPSSY